MWEWLRRDQAYVQWYATASQSTLSAAPQNWGCIYAESPTISAPSARIIWNAELDPATIAISVSRAQTMGPDIVDVDTLAPWLQIAHGENGSEHAVLTDGWRRIRLDVLEGSLAEGGCMAVDYRISGVASAQQKILPLRRFLHLVRHRRFGRSLYPRDRKAARWATLLQVHDGIAAGASQREIGAVLFGKERIVREWDGHSDSLRSRVRRMVCDARSMAGGGYRRLMRR